MKISTLSIIMLVMSFSLQTMAQQAPSKNPYTKYQTRAENIKSRISYTAGMGLASYWGDLTEGNKLLDQPGLAFSAGILYGLTSHLNGRFEVGIQRVRAADSKNSNPGLVARNLSFKSNVYDVSAILEANLFDLTQRKFTPYVFAGVGLMFFDPFTVESTGNKQKLRNLNTEGQGIANYEKPYSRTAIQIPVGLGIKYVISPVVTISGELNYHLTNTDYLDDVSMDRYPVKSQLDAQNPATSRFTYRGYEVGAGPYPANLQLNRGNPGNKDVYYSTQLKVAFRL